MAISIPAIATRSNCSWPYWASSMNGLRWILLPVKSTPKSSRRSTPTAASQCWGSITRLSSANPMPSATIRRKALNCCPRTVMPAPRCCRGYSSSNTVTNHLSPAHAISTSTWNYPRKEKRDTTPSRKVGIRLWGSWSRD